MTETPSQGSSVPALEKGMDVLEFLAVQNNPVTLQEISTGLHRSRGELYRMVKWLVEQRYIVRNDADDTYVLGERIGRLFQRQPAAKNVISIALPLMEQISRDIGAACYLSVRANPHSIVVANTLSSEIYDLTTRLGTQMSLVDCAAGSCLVQTLDTAERDALYAGMSKEQRDSFTAECDALVKQGFVQRFGVSGPGYFELSLPGPTQGQLITAITLVKIVRARQEAQRIVNRIKEIAIPNIIQLQA